MAPKGIEMGLVLVLVVMLWGGAAAQSGCTNVIIGMAPCLNYITGNSSTPSSSCCSQLTSVVQSQPQCLCSVLNSGGSALGIAINQTRALALPGACNVQTPPVSQCNAANGPPSTSPAISPSGSPADSTDGMPESPISPSVPGGTGSKTIPSTDGNSSDGSSMKMSLHLLFIVSCASVFIGF